MSRIATKSLAFLWLVALAGVVTVGLLDATESAALVRLTNDVAFLASDELEGRGPGTKGLERAAEFIRQEFRRIGLKSAVADGSYFQPFEVTLGETPVDSETLFLLRGPDNQQLRLELGNQFQPFFTGKTDVASAPIAFVGYGISAPDLKYDDYRDLNVEGKIVILIRREPQQDVADSPFDGRNVTSHSYVTTKLKQALDRNAAAVLLVNDPFTVRKEQADAFFPTHPAVRNANIAFAQVKLPLVDQILATTPLVVDDQRLTSVEQVAAYIDRTLQPVSQDLAGWTGELKFTFQTQLAPVANVVGVLDGSGPQANETVIIGAHYDHLGYGGLGSRRPNSRQIHNGADDNASGTAALLELARRFAARQQPPARRMLFIAFTAEERGLLGSNYYTNNPLFPLQDTVAMVNFDMIGTLRDNSLDVHGTGSGKQFDSIVDEAAGKTDLQIQKKPAVMAASDHFPFYQKKIPVVFFFTGLTETYHTPDDDVERLNFEGMEKIVGYAEEFLHLLVQYPERIVFQQAPAGGRGGRGMAYLGITPDYNSQPGGVRVAAVRPESPADRAGVHVGDVIVRIEEKPVADVAGLADALRQFRPGQTVAVTVRRDDQEVALMVQLAPPGRGAP